jgi:hypothetical protein
MVSFWQLDPTGGAKVAFTICTKAWEVCVFDYMSDQWQLLSFLYF